MKRWMVLLLFGLVWHLSATAVHAQDGLRVVSKIPDTAISYQITDTNQLLVTVLDADEAPVRGLTADAVEVWLGPKKAQLLSFEPLETSETVGLNIVMVVDNSASMKRRRAIAPLLSAMQAFLRIMRPIDTLHMIVFDDDATVAIDGRDLHVKNLTSSSVVDLKTFLDDAFERGLSDKTVLYEAMVAGLAAARRMPEKDNKFFVVFTDGEDINSAFESDVVAAAAEGIPNLEAYVVDYMPGKGLNPFLQNFARGHGGRVWKATAATDLVPIFQSFSTRLRYRYVATYRLLDPPSGAIDIKPAALFLDVLTMLDGTPLKNTLFFPPGKSDIARPYVRFENREQAMAFQPETLTPGLERYFNLLNITGHTLAADPGLTIRIQGFNDGTDREKDNRELSERRALSVKTYLHEIWGVAASRMQTAAGNLPEKAAPPGQLGASAENRRVEITYDRSDQQATVAGGFIGERGGVDAIDIVPAIRAEYGVADWALEIWGDDVQIAVRKGKGDLAPAYSFPLDGLDRQQLANVHQLQTWMTVTDTSGETFETDAALCDIQVSRRPVIHEILVPPSGTLAMAPAFFTVEELTTIDSAPLLNYIYFDVQQDSIPEGYVTFRDQAAARAFSAGTLQDPMEKYRNLLNIIGKRLVENPGAAIEIVGCNSNFGPERNRTDLSRLRAQSVQSYLKYIWGVDAKRMTVTARNLPAAASSGKTGEGRAENRRVEILSASPAVLDVIRSTRVEPISNARKVRVTPDIQADYGLRHWQIDLLGDGQPFRSMNGTGLLAADYTFELDNADLLGFGAFENISAEIKVEDVKGGQFKARTPDAPVTFIRKEERFAQKEGYKVLERYALILFDFDSARIKDRNQAVVDRIAGRIEVLPAVTVTITGHTDNIGKPEYNLKLSQKRARAVYDQLTAAIGSADGVSISHTGVGPDDPLYDNSEPWGRALNRTVTITLAYEVKE